MLPRPRDFSEPIAGTDTEEMQLVLDIGLICDD